MGESDTSGALILEALYDFGHGINEELYEH